jgi:hypothetical protein
MAVRDVAEASEMAPAIWLTIPPGLPTSMTFGALGMAAGLRAGQAAAGARKLLPASGTPPE